MRYVATVITASGIVTIHKCDKYKKRVRVATAIIASGIVTTEIFLLCHVIIVATVITASGIKKKQDVMTFLKEMSLRLFLSQAF